MRTKEEVAAEHTSGSVEARRPSSLLVVAGVLRIKPLVATPKRPRVVAFAHPPRLNVALQAVVDTAARQQGGTTQATQALVGFPAGRAVETRALVEPVRMPRRREKVGVGETTIAAAARLAKAASVAVVVARVAATPVVAGVEEDTLAVRPSAAAAGYRVVVAAPLRTQRPLA